MNAFSEKNKDITLWQCNKMDTGSGTQHWRAGKLSEITMKKFSINFRKEIYCIRKYKYFELQLRMELVNVIHQFGEMNNFSHSPVS